MACIMKFDVEVYDGRDKEKARYRVCCDKEVIWTNSLKKAVEYLELAIEDFECAYPEQYFRERNK